MKDPARAVACRNCHRAYPAHRLDRYRWCDACRREVVRRATRAARVIAGVGSFVLAVWVALSIGSNSRFLIGWVVLVVAVWFVLYKLSQRVAFEVIRGRGVPPPPEE